MLITYGGDSGLLMCLRRGDKAGAARVTFGQGARDIIKIPSAGGIHPVKMDEFPVTRIKDNGRGQPIR